MGAARLGRRSSPQVAPRDFQAIARRRAKRALSLAERFPAAREALTFYAAVASFQLEVPADSPLSAREGLIRLVLETGPEPLGEAARALTEAACRQALDDYLAEKDTTSPRSFFARVLLQPVLVQTAATGASESRISRHGPQTSEPRTSPSLGLGGSDAVEGKQDARRPGRCPCCGHPPQVGCLRPEGDGATLSLACSLCLWEWPYTRSCCPGCGESDAKHIAYYSAEEPAHLKVQACETCGRYLHLVDFGREPEAVADVDEIAALPLDVWAREQGLEKLHPNLVGM